MNEIKVLSGDLDGAQLRREMRANPYHDRCTGTADDGTINYAISCLGQSRVFCLSTGVWERIFGGKN